MLNKRDNSEKLKRMCKRVLDGKHLPAVETPEISPELIEHIVSEQEKIRNAMYDGTLDTVLRPDEQLSLFDAPPKSVKIHIFSVLSGYYEDNIDWTEENDAFISKWIDKDTGCLYSLVLFPNNEPERVFVTRDIFRKVYKYRYDDCEDLL